MTTTGYSYDKLEPQGYSYDKLESKIARYLTRKPDQLFSYRFLVNEISLELDLKDPTLLKKLKDDIGIVMRFLKKYDNFDVIEENGSLNVIYMTQSDDSKKIYEMVDPPSLDGEMDKQDIQSGLAVAQFIVDNNLNDFFQQKDHKGNTALHYFMIHGDSDRAEKLIKIDESSLLQKNSEGDTPIDLIKDIRMSNSLLREILSDKLKIQNKIENMQIELCKTKDVINEFRFIRDSIMYIIMIYTIYVFLLLFFRF